MRENGRIRVNGIRIYYEVHGRADGIPVVLLPGGGSTIETTFGRVLPALAASHRVIAVEEQGHGRTSDREQPITFESSADDVAGLVRQLGLEQVDIVGFSNGASVGLQVAIRHPGLVRKLVFASAMTKRDGAHAGLWDFMAGRRHFEHAEPLKDAFLKVNPDEHQLKVMHDKDAQRMREFKDVGDDLVRSIRSAVLIVVGDRDVVRLEHAVELSRQIPHARLLVLPSGHGEYLGEIVAAPNATRYPELTAGLIEEFLAPSQEYSCPTSQVYALVASLSRLSRSP